MTASHAPPPRLRTRHVNWRAESARERRRIIGTAGGPSSCPTTSARRPHAHAVAFAQFLGVEKVGFFRDNATTDCLTRVKPWLARLPSYARA